MTVAIVPGAFYVEHPETGADGRFVLEEAARLGCRTARVPLLSFGPLRENARTLARLARPAAAAADRSGVAEQGRCGSPPGACRNRSAARPFPTRRGLDQPQRPGARNGDGQLAVPAALRALGVRLLFWWNGYSFDALHELERWPGIARRRISTLPEELLAVHLYGFPLVQHLSRPIARRGHRRLAPLGPTTAARICWRTWSGCPARSTRSGAPTIICSPPGTSTALLRRLLLYVAEQRLGSAGPRLGTGREQS